MTVMNPCIAVIDDEAPVLEMLRDLLEGGGFSVLAFDRPEHLRDDDGAIQPDLFLIDLMLPGTTGIELAGELRVTGFPNTPMIAMSASKSMTLQASQSGLFQETIYKPFDLHTLLMAVERYVA